MRQLAKLRTVLSERDSTYDVYRVDELGSHEIFTEEMVEQLVYAAAPKGGLLFFDEDFLGLLGGRSVRAFIYELVVLTGKRLVSARVPMRFTPVNTTELDWRPFLL